MPRNPRNPAYNRTVTAAKKREREARIKKIREDAAAFTIPLYMIGEEAGYSVSNFKRAVVSDEVISAYENALFVLKMKSMPHSVVSTWECRLEKIGLTRYRLVRGYGVCDIIAQRMREYAIGERRPFRKSVEMIEALVRRAEQDFREATHGS